MKPKRQKVWTLKVYVILKHDGEPAKCYPAAPTMPWPNLTRKDAADEGKRLRSPKEKPYRVQRATLTLALEDDKS